ncbi:hypothetical protein D9758_001875 [Tetrapyrgos nigripes]|uniref:Uncharacterized protein n=1 Tax=Tetrapyrgos nigripes TaxID=182062 RepID=A0A8H5GT27_9AGAR|nr:hypothetical protein D9758_001875 [Tetrapyrgos nigripes]
MPPKAAGKAAKPAKTSASRVLITTGPKDVSKAHGKGDGTRDERPTTTRALILRKSKYGAFGEGEVFLMSKMTGREKLDLLAEDLIEKSSKAVMAPFRIERCITIAESQCSRYLDEITNMKDKDFFYSIITEEVKARNLAEQAKNKGNDRSRDPSFIASAISHKVHNAYLLASGWKFVTETLYTLAEEGLTDERVTQQLGENEELRSRYLALYHLVSDLVDLGQNKFSVLATTTPHYAKYFKTVEDELGEKQVKFDDQALRGACTSFLDSVIVELCFPRGKYPKAILYQILHDAVEEAPKEARRFPQLLWDFVGDLSDSVLIQQLLEAPLHGEIQKWRDEPRKQTEEYDRWTDAVVASLVAADMFANFKDTVVPLEKTKQADTLTKMWKFINQNYKAVAGKDIDTLWNLSKDLEPTPQWHYFVINHRASHFDEDKAQPAGAKKKLLAIKNEPDSDTDDSMPALQDVSDSDESEIWSDDEDEDDSDSDGDESYDSGYNTDQEDEIRDLVREAMDAAHDPHFMDDEDTDSTEDVRKGNPFLKLLGRVFSPNSKLQTPAAGARAPPQPASSKKQKTATTSPQTRSRMTTVEEVEDEDDAVRASKKKKKKPKKKKKTTTEPSAEDAASVATPPPRTPSPPPPSPPPVAKPSPKRAAAKPKPAVKPTPAAGQSFTSLSLPVLEQTETAQSARSYLQSQPEGKEKIKSRGKEASIFSSVKRKLGVSREDRDEKEVKEEKKQKKKWFASLGKKTRAYMHQLLNTPENETKGAAGMKWDTFVKVMEDVGFKYDPSTAGSSVKFVPPDPRDPPITFHKPHPDPTLQPVMLKEFSKKLRRYYGWSPEDLME